MSFYLFIYACNQPNTLISVDDAEQIASSTQMSLPGKNSAFITSDVE